MTTYEEYKNCIGQWQQLGYYACPIAKDPSVKLQPYDAGSNFGLYCEHCGTTYFTFDPQNSLKYPDKPESTQPQNTPEPTIKQ